MQKEKRNHSYSISLGKSENVSCFPTMSCLWPHKEAATAHLVTFNLSSSDGE